MPSPITALDHIELPTVELDAVSRDYENLLGHPPAWRGTLAGARAARFDLGNMALLLRENPSTAALGCLGFRVDDAGRMARRLERLGLPLRAEGSTNPLPPPTGGASVRVLELDPAGTRSVPVRFVARDGAAVAAAPPATAAADTVGGLDHVVIATDDGDATAALYGARFGLDMRLDLTRPDWGVRLMFFRCGDLIVEVAQRTDDPASAGAPTASAGDRFYGLTWRVGNADAARERLAAAGVDVSEVRPGRRPGSRVFTVRQGTGGVPTLMIEPPGAAH